MFVTHVCRFFFIGFFFFVLTVFFFLKRGYYYFGGGELDRALIATMTAYSIFLLHRNSLSHMTIQRLYTWIIGTSSDPRMRENWFNMADTECSFICKGFFFFFFLSHYCVQQILDVIGFLKLLSI